MNNKQSITMDYTNNKDKIISGLNTAADIITSTMGAEGKTVAIYNKLTDELRFTKDGVSVAREIKFDDPYENIGAKILISSANETVKQVGDATTLTSLWTKCFVNELVNLPQESINANLSEIEDTIEQIEVLINEQFKQEVKTLDDIESIAMISSNSKEVASLFKELYSKTKFDALIKLQKSDYTNYTYFETLQGFAYDSGYVHPSFMTNKDTEECIYDNPIILIESDNITSVTDEHKKLIGAIHQQETPLVIMAPDFSDAFIRFASMNKVNNGVQVVLVKIPGSTEHSKSKNVEDIKAILTEDGYVDRVIVTPYATTFFNQDTPFLEDRIKTLTSLRANSVEWWEDEDYQKRIHKLQGSSAIIYVGAATKESQSELYDRIEDAVGAIQSSVNNGYVIGGGYTSFILSTLINNNIVKNILRQPAYTIIDNANFEIKLSEIHSKMVNENKVFNLYTKQWELANQSNIYDAANSIVEAIKNSFGSAKLIVNSSYFLIK